MNNRSGQGTAMMDGGRGTIAKYTEAKVQPTSDKVICPFYSKRHM
jgi:hypothetical protein